MAKMQTKASEKISREETRGNFLKMPLLLEVVPKIPDVPSEIRKTQKLDYPGAGAISPIWKEDLPKLRRRASWLQLSSRHRRPATAD